MRESPEPLTEAEAAARSPAGIRHAWQEFRAGRLFWKPVLRRDASGSMKLLDWHFVLAKAALEFGESFLALDISELGIGALRTLRQELENELPEDESRLDRLAGIRAGHRGLVHIKALALARTGSTAAAADALETLDAPDDEDLQTLTARARVYKDFGMAQVPWDRPYLRQSHELYLEAFRRYHDHFPGVNAASTAAFLGEAATAAAIAEQVKELCEQRLRADPTDYWTVASLAETLLIQREFALAKTRYQEATRLAKAKHRWANLSTTRVQARRICDALQIEFDSLEDAFEFPSMIVFSGHMIDRKDRESPRFPPEREAEVRALIRDRIREVNAGIAVCSAACGSDLIFIDEMLDAGADVHVVLPWGKDEFVRSSVAVESNSPTDWTALFDSCLGRVNSVTFLSQQTEPKAIGLGYEYLNECISGLAILRARFLDARVVPLVVWDGRRGDGPGGTQSFVNFWRHRGAEAEIIELTPPTQQPAAAAKPWLSTEDPSLGQITVSRGQPTVKTVLFADVSGYSKIPERSIASFVSKFLEEVSSLIAQGAQRPVLTNTWGDALYLVFDEPVAAGEFALNLLARVQGRRWAADGLPDDLNMRIALHTGPVMLCFDPVIRHMTFTGSHVSHAARIEPIVQNGQIWASEAFAAQVAIARPDAATPSFDLDYLGQTEFAKNYGRYPLYRVRRR